MSFSLRIILIHEVLCLVENNYSGLHFTQRIQSYLKTWAVLSSSHSFRRCSCYWMGRHFSHWKTARFSSRVTEENLDADRINTWWHNNNTPSAAHSLRCPWGKRRTSNCCSEPFSSQQQEIVIIWSNFECEGVSIWTWSVNAHQAIVKLFQELKRSGGERQAGPVV